MTHASSSARPTTQATPGAKQQYLNVYEREHATTANVLRSYPDDKLDLRPHAKCKTARELAWLMVAGQKMIEKALSTGFDWSAPPPAPVTPPATMEAIVDALDQEHERVVGVLRDLSDEDLSGTVQFFVSPKTLGEVPKLQFIWMMLHDQIHHRGQFSIYLRMADAKVPSIYGPTADEPWR